MHMHTDDSTTPHGDDYLVSRRQAWFAFAMTFGLMLFDYIDRQVIVSLFPFLKAEWHLSDKELGALVSIISLVVAAGAMPVALVADRLSRVKSVVVMAVTWSLATTSCMFAGNYSQLFAARAVVGLGEAGYGSVGTALIASLFPRRLRSAMLGALFAAASLGSVLGVLLGGVVAAHWGWKAAFGVVGIPGLLLSVMYLLVRDYKTVELSPDLKKAAHPGGGVLMHALQGLVRSRTLLWTCTGAAMQCIAISAVWAWLPSFFNRYHGMSPEAAAKQAAVIVLCGAFGSVIWGAVVDKFGAGRPDFKMKAVAAMCVATAMILCTAFSTLVGGSAQVWLVALGGFMMTCTIGPVSAITADVVHPGFRSTGMAVLSLFQNLLGLAIGPIVAGALSDLWGLQQALSVVPMVSVLAALCLMTAKRSYRAELQAMVQIKLDVAPLDHALTEAHA